MSDETKEPGGSFCSFCGKHESEVDGMMAGPAAFICDECVALCFEVIGARKAERGLPWPPAEQPAQPSGPEG